MKKTKIFIAACCLLVAGIGVAATKANTQTTFDYYYEVTVGNPATCELFQTTTDPECVTTETNPCSVLISTPIGDRQLFLSEVGGSCVTPLTKE